MNNILLGVIGKTPQVLTETLYYLSVVRSPRVPISEIKVITTTLGRDGIMDTLFSDDESILDRFCADYNIDRESITFTEDDIILLRDEHRNPVQDIRDVDDNVRAGNQILDVVHQLTQNSDNTIYASIAGGRKTMSVYLGFAMQIFARSQDELLHVLVPEQYERTFQKDFFYPRPDDQEHIQVELSEIPFVRLGKLLPKFDTEISYPDLVEHLQESLEHGLGYPAISISTDKPSVYVGEQHIAFSPREMAFIATLAKQKIHNCVRPEQEFCEQCTDCFIGPQPNKENILLLPQSFIRDFIKNYRAYNTRYYGENNPTEDRIMNEEDNIQMLREIISTVNDKTSQQLGTYLSQQGFSIRSIRKGDNSYYGLSTDKTKIAFERD